MQVDARERGLHENEQLLWCLLNLLDLEAYVWMFVKRPIELYVT